MRHVGKVYVVGEVYVPLPLCFNPRISYPPHPLRRVKQSKAGQSKAGQSKAG
ncbi:hypothetical protein [Verrucosispora sp. WMMD573]|uniref:hypothetical protein n=1 Tax=Verrucosispora sp. WMMD573 TaxID=3015149 RepID=UPI00248C3017|nr:hypothetical protein [Verrucosispora sp. WMMD573]WBB52122.1 hypothetical protein O7601_16000 [Verrucosispora sp. WMMD573]